MAHIPFLDHIRGVAIFMVYIYHAIGASYGQYVLGWKGMFPDFGVRPSLLALVPGMFGWFGVSVFFALSGFCIHLSHARSSRRSWVEFFIRRGLRIYPPYLLALLLFSFCPPWSMVSLSSLYDVKQFIAHALLLHNLDDRTFYAINPSFWSVAVEFQLYALYPLILWVAHKTGWTRALWALAVVELSLRAGVRWWEISSGHGAAKIVVGSPFYYGFSWALGAAAADAFLSGRKSALLKWPLWLWPLLAVVCFLYRPLEVFNSTIFSIGTVHVILWLLERPRRQDGPVPGWVARHFSYAGVVSFSLYLINQPLLELVPPAVKQIFGAEVHPLVIFAACMLAWFPLLALATPVFRWIEKPSIAWGKAAVAAWRRRRGAAS